MVNDKAAATGYKPKNQTEAVAMNLSRGDIMVALRILVLGLVATILFLFVNSNYGWFLLAVSAFTEIAQAIRYASIVIREKTAVVYNVTNNSTHTHPGL